MVDQKKRQTLLKRNSATNDVKCKNSATNDVKCKSPVFNEKLPGIKEAGKYDPLPGVKGGGNRSENNYDDRISN